MHSGYISRSKHCFPNDDQARRLHTMHSWNTSLAASATSGPSSSHVTSPFPQLRLAQCLTGILKGGKVDSRDSRRGWQIDDERAYRPLLELSELLVHLNVLTDFFLNLDMRVQSLPRRVAAGQSLWLTAEKANFDPLTRAECNVSGEVYNRNRLDGLLSALRPVSVHTANTKCYCQRRDCSCLPAGTFMQWFEQFAKVKLCYESVVRHEMQQGFRYDFILRLRADYAVHRNGMSAVALVAAMQRTLQGTARVMLHPWLPTSSQQNASEIVDQRTNKTYTPGPACYGNADWFQMAPRELADATFSIDDASCDWFRCLERKFLAQRATGSNRFCDNIHWSDGLLVEWLLSRHAPFEAMLMDMPLDSHGYNQQEACVYPRVTMGLITERHASQQPAMCSSAALAAGSGDLTFQAPAEQGHGTQERG